MHIINEQQLLLAIVETWKLSQTPEYRGFRCAHCQKYKNSMWYYFLTSFNYRLPVHLCNDGCKQSFSKGTLNINPAKRLHVNHNTFGLLYKFVPKTANKFEEIIIAWPKNKKPELKNMFCDLCKKDLDIDPNDNQRKGFHVWYKMKDKITLAELHFHKDCALKLKILSDPGSS